MPPLLEYPLRLLLCFPVLVPPVSLVLVDSHINLCLNLSSSIVGSLVKPFY